MIIYHIATWALLGRIPGKPRIWCIKKKRRTRRNSFPALLAFRWVRTAFLLYIAFGVRRGAHNDQKLLSDLEVQAACRSAKFTIRLPNRFQFGWPANFIEAHLCKPSRMPLFFPQVCDPKQLLTVQTANIFKPRILKPLFTLFQCRLLGG